MDWELGEAKFAANMIQLVSIEDTLHNTFFKIRKKLK